MRNNQSGGKGGKGYYIALVLCAAAIGITSYVTRSSHKPEPEKISLMEQEFGVPLFDRTRKTVCLTEAGRLFYDLFSDFNANFKKRL